MSEFRLSSQYADIKTECKATGIESKRVYFSCIVDDALVFECKDGETLHLFTVITSAANTAPICSVRDLLSIPKITFFEHEIYLKDGKESKKIDGRRWKSISSALN